MAATWKGQSPDLESDLNGQLRKRAELVESLLHWMATCWSVAPCAISETAVKVSSRPVIDILKLCVR